MDQVSGTVAKRQGLVKTKEQLRNGDILVVWRLCHLGRLLCDLIDWVRYIDEKGVGLESSREAFCFSYKEFYQLHVFAYPKKQP